MPSSFHDALPVVLPFVIGLGPQSVLDVGVGFGKYGFLFREYLDVGGADQARPFDPGTRRIRIDGIEAHLPYVTELQRMIYDTIHVGEALERLPRLGRYDLVFAADVLEHFTRAGGDALLAACAAVANLGVLIVTPALDIHQGAAFGNLHEIHRSFWTPADFAGIPSADVLVWRRQLIAFLPSDGVRRSLPRPTLREAAGLVLRACLARAVGPVRSEVWLQRVRHQRG